jgi:protein-disulfide isomerase
MEENWKTVVQNIEEAQSRGVLVTPLTVFGDDGKIIGWYLDGWKPPPMRVLYKPDD